MKAQPGIVFLTAKGGDRRAALAAGPQVWTVAHAWLQHDKDERTAAVVADAVGLTAADVESALAYWAEHHDEIDGLIARHQASQDAHDPLLGGAGTAPERELACSINQTLS